MLETVKSNVRKNKALLRRLSSKPRQVKAVQFLSVLFGSTQYLACLLLLQVHVDSMDSEDNGTISAFYPSIDDEVNACILSASLA